MITSESSVTPSVMPAYVQSIVETGGGVTIDVECHINKGLPNIIIVGFANKAVDEAKERVRSAFADAKLELPRKRIIINLAPADLPKDGTSFDLAIACAILAASKRTIPKLTTDTPVFGELGLDGDVRPVRGIIGKLLAGKQLGYTQFIIPAGNHGQASLIPGIILLPVTTLIGLYMALTEVVPFQKVAGGTKPIEFTKLSFTNDFRDVVGQFRAKRALEIAAAGDHNILLSGSPGLVLNYRIKDRQWVQFC